MELEIGRTYTYSPANYNAEADDAHIERYCYSEYDIVDKNSNILCMVGESVTLVDVKDNNVVLYNDNNCKTFAQFTIEQEKFNKDFCINSID